MGGRNYRGKKGSSLTVVCNLETGEPLADFFRSESPSRERKRIEVACVDRWELFRLSVGQWRSVQNRLRQVPYHSAKGAIQELRRAEFLGHGEKKRGIKSKQWS
jgi:hypothetical protein